MRDIDNIGPWLRIQRENRGLLTRELDEKSGIGFGSISRIENKKTSPTVYTCIRLLDALGLGLNDFEPSDNVLNSGDIPDETYTAFRSLYERDADGALSLVQEWLNRMCMIMDSEPDAFSDSAMQKLLVAYRQLEVRVLYPSDYTVEAVLDIWKFGGDLQRRDIHMLLGNYPVDSRAWKSLSRQSQDVLRRLKAMEDKRIVASDVERLGNQLGVDVLGLVCFAYSEKEREHPINPRLVSAFVALWYWLKAADPDGELLNEFTQTIGGFNA